jgi:hypothetical protein
MSLFIEQKQKCSGKNYKYVAALVVFFIYTVNSEE